jgi:competence protein ComEA
MSKLKKAALYLGFTQTEFNIILFLTSVFIIGIALTFIKKNSSYTELKNYNYETRDSLFLKAAAGSQLMNASEEGRSEIGDYPSVKVFPKSAAKTPLQEKSININLADINELMRLPGIGNKTAIKIMELRKKKGGFTKIEDLKEIKGIGDSKLEKISKYIYIK